MSILSAFGLRRLRLFVSVFAIMLASACGGNPPAGHPVPSGLSEALPGLPAAAAQRSTSAVQEHVFGEPDQAASSNIFWSDDELNMDTPVMAWSIVGLNIGTETPNTFSVAGVTMDELYVAVSDYGSGRWNFIGKALTEAQTFELPKTQLVNGSGAIYFALISPAGAGAIVTASLSFSDSGTGEDTTPPVWQGDEGIVSVDASHYLTELTWHEAIDADSPPVSYLIYTARTEDGINWDTPSFEIPAGTLSASVAVHFENTEPYDYAVRARDAVGNITQNTNFLSAAFSGATGTQIFDWLPGDRVELSWLDPSSNAQLMIVGPADKEGWPEEPAGLDGIIEFSEGSESSGLAFETATLLPGAPAGGYKVVLSYEGGQTYTFRLYDSEGALKQTLGSYSTEFGTSGAIDYAYLCHQPNSWPQSANWRSGYKLKLSWSDPQQDLDLFVQDPAFRFGTPAFHTELEGIVDFSEDNMVSGVPEEWIGLGPLSEYGEYILSIQWQLDNSNVPAPPLSIDVTWTLLDDLDQPVIGPGVVTLYNDGSLFAFPQISPFAWLNYPEQL